jgi:hypothetical protein
LLIIGLLYLIYMDFPATYATARCTSDSRPAVPRMWTYSTETERTDRNVDFADRPFDFPSIAKNIPLSAKQINGKQQPP